MAKKKPPKLSRPTVNALDAMWRALAELEGVMPDEQFRMLRAGLQYAEAEVEDALRRGASLDDKPLGVDRMEARWAYQTYCWFDPPPEDEVHWSGRKAKSEWAKRYVAYMTGTLFFDAQARHSGFTERQAFEAATREKRDRKQTEREARLRKEREEHEQYFGRPRRPGADDDPGR